MGGLAVAALGNAGSDDAGTQIGESVAGFETLRETKRFQFANIRFQFANIRFEDLRLPAHRWRKIGGARCRVPRDECKHTLGPRNSASLIHLGQPDSYFLRR